MRRVVAVLGAVLMVVVAVLVRGVLDDDEGGGGGSGGSGGGGDGEVTLLCVEELEAACEALADDGAVDDYQVEEAGETIDRLAAEGAELGADAWLTLEPFSGIAGVARDEAGLGPYFTGADPLGWSTSVAVVVHPARAEAATGACPDPLEWPCIADLAGDQWADHGGEASWGEIKVGIDRPDTATGLLTAAHIVAAVLDDVGFATNDLADSDVLRRLGRFEEGDDVLARMVTQGPGAFSAVGALDRPAQELADTARGEGLGIFYPAPMIRTEVALVRPAGAGGDLPEGDDLDGALEAAGFQREPGSELPSPGALYALWEELT